VSRYVDEHRGRFEVEPICRTLGVSASAYYQRKTGARSARSLRDERLLARIRELHAANYYAYGSRRIWIALNRAGEPVARCAVERLMCAHGICGATRRGKPWRTTRPDPAARRRPDLVDRNFTAAGPNRLWVADITRYRRLTDNPVLRRLLESGQYTSIHYTQTLADHGVLASVGSVGDAYDNALAESFKTELIADRVWRTRNQLELAVVEYLGWFRQRPHSPALGDLPPAEFETLSPPRDETITTTKRMLETT
jgi:putative transposase